MSVDYYCVVARKYHTTLKFAINSHLLTPPIRCKGAVWDLMIRPPAPLSNPSISAAEIIWIHSDPNDVAPH